MIIGWFFSLFLIWWRPSALALFNPFLAIISKAIQERKLYTTLWASYLTGLLRDIILSSPRLGILGFSSLVTGALVYRLARLCSLEGWQGSFVVGLLALVEFFFDTVFCYVAGRLGEASFSSVWSWKGFFLFVVFSCLWACALGLLTMTVRWVKTRTVRRSSS